MNDVFEIKQSGWWNYTQKDKPGYSLEITGDVVEISARQKIDFNSKQPAFKKNGEPIVEFVVTIATANGDELNWTVKNSFVIEAILAALHGVGVEGRNLSRLGGFNVTISTPESVPTGQARAFFVTINGQAAQPFRGAFNRINNQPQPVQAAGQPVQYQQVQQVPQQPVQQAPQAQPVQQMPEGVDPYTGEYVF